MGLDMYLTKRIYIGANYEFNGIAGEINLTRKGKPIEIPLKRVTYIECDAGYWRKANAIHNWFVNNVQGGEDDCESYEVTPEKLGQLLDTVNTVLRSSTLGPGPDQEVAEIVEGSLKTVSRPVQTIVDPSVAEELLPNVEGFFFGSQEYDEWYYGDLVHTRDVLTECLRDTSDDVTFLYRSSW